MESRKIQFYEFNPDDLKNEILKGFDHRLSKYLNSSELPKEEELLTVDETIKFLKCSKQALWNWRKNGILPAYRLGNRVYYKKSDIFNKLIKQD